MDEIISNLDGLYEGNLVHYFQTIFFKATNVNLPYHNFHHMTHVFWLCHQACVYYEDTLSPREMRNLLIGALFHDFDHRGTFGDDHLNAALAIQGLKKYILKEDLPYLDEIVAIIKATEVPYKTPSEALNLSQQIIRDADMSQALNVAWLQQVIFGLASEWNKTPIEVLKEQIEFHKTIKFATVWAQKKWPQKVIDEKIDETTHLLKILEL